MTDKVVNLFPDATNFWNQFAKMYADPRNVGFRRAVKEQSDTYEKLLLSHPDLRNYKEPETEGSLVVTVKIAFKPGKMHIANVDGYLREKLFTSITDILDLEVQESESEVVEILPRSLYHPGDVFDNPISVQEVSCD